ncbi:MAG: hypothetical protein V3T81_07155 [Thermoanaerobaculia bacterium]
MRHRHAVSLDDSPAVLLRCAARVHAISSHPRASVGDTIPSCPQRVRCPPASLWVARSGAHSDRLRRKRINHPG